MGDDLETRARLLDWLLEGDPSIRWQGLRDLEAVAEPVWRAEQGRVASEGWGARLLEHQGDDGRWTPWLYGKKWISTTYTLVLLRRLGMPPSERIDRSCRLFFDEGQRPDGGITASRPKGSRSETCVTGMVLAFLCWFQVDDPRREGLVDYLLVNQMADGGWNCIRGADHSSFHTTISVLEALREYADANGPRVAETEAAEAGGREFMLRHRLFKSHHTRGGGERPVPAVLLPPAMALRHPARPRLLLGSREPR